MFLFCYFDPLRSLFFFFPFRGGRQLGSSAKWFKHHGVGPLCPRVVYNLSFFFGVEASRFAPQVAPWDRFWFPYPLRAWGVEDALCFPTLRPFPGPLTCSAVFTPPRCGLPPKV